jgi:hypothetical protein
MNDLTMMEILDAWINTAYTTTANGYIQEKTDYDYEIDKIIAEELNGDIPKWERFERRLINRY